MSKLLNDLDNLDCPPPLLLLGLTKTAGGCMLLAELGLTDPRAEEVERTLLGAWELNIEDQRAENSSFSYLRSDGREEVEKVTGSLLLQLVVEKTNEVWLAVNIDLGEDRGQELHHGVHTCQGM